MATTAQQRGRGRPARKAPADKGTSFRLDASDLALLDAEVERVNAERRDGTASRTSVIRLLVRTHCAPKAS